MKIENSGVFKKTANYRKNPDIFRQPHDAGTQSTYASNDEIDFYTSA